MTRGPVAISVPAGVKPIGVDVESESFSFEKARPVTAGETEAARKGIAQSSAPSGDGPTAEGTREEYQVVSIRLSPEAPTWALDHEEPSHGNHWSPLPPVAHSAVCELTDAVLACF